jgi:hypothetical protein
MRSPIIEPSRPRAKPEVVTVAQTLLWILFANWSAVAAYDFIRTQFYLNGPRDYFSVALTAAVAAAFGILSILLGRRALLTWCATMLLCISAMVFIAVHILSVMSDPYWYERKSVSELVLYVLAFVAVPLAAVVCLATRGAWKWCLDRDESTTTG